MHPRATGLGLARSLALVAFALTLSPPFAAKDAPHLPSRRSTLGGTGVTLHLSSGIAIDEANGNVFIFGAEGGTPWGAAYFDQITGFSFGLEPSGVAVDNYRH